MDKWEMVARPNNADVLERIDVPGGWLYRSYCVGEQDGSQSMVFVPKPAGNHRVVEPRK